MIFIQIIHDMTHRGNIVFACETLFYIVGNVLLADLNEKNSILWIAVSYFVDNILTDIKVVYMKF